MSEPHFPAADWRKGAVIYQVIVDRFAPSANLEAKRALYPAPKTLEAWESKPTGGHFVPEAGVWSHEIAFWGGDLKSLTGKLDYVKSLGIDVLYLNPIHKAYTNHKYDAWDFAEVSPEYGTREDVKNLAAELHKNGMKLMLDGVFNHMGKTSPYFQEAQKDPKSKYRDWFVFGPEFKHGYRGWASVENLPELHLEHKPVRDYLWNGQDSVVQKYLREGVDGWRLDVAFDIGPQYLSEMTEASHKAKPGSAVVGEIWNYPEKWFPALDGVMNFHLREIVTHLVKGEVSGPKAGRMIDRMIQDAGLDPILRSWIVLDNHDTERLSHLFPNPADLRLAQTLQFVLPGCPVIYYGTELGMKGGNDPESRAPMRWDLVREDNAELAFVKKLLAIRAKHPALKTGDFRILDTEQLLAFTRFDGTAKNMVMVVVNPTDHPVKEIVSSRESWLMNWENMKDLLTGDEATIQSGIIQCDLAPHSVRLYSPVMRTVDGYTNYKRVP